MKLTFELVPEECWGQNLRSMLTDKQWDVVRKDAYKRYGYRCAVCGQKGRMEAHEVWDYDDGKAIQKLVDVVALCHACHEVKHVSRAYLVGRGEEAEAWFCKVNGVSQSAFHAYLGTANEQYKRRNAVENWTTDVSWLVENYGFSLPYLYGGKR